MSNPAVAKITVLLYALESFVDFAFAEFLKIFNVHSTYLHRAFYFT